MGAAIVEPTGNIDFTSLSVFKKKNFEIDGFET